MPATLQAQSGPGVELTVDGRHTIFLSRTRIEGLPQESHSYHDLGPAGGQTVTRSGVTVGQLLSAAGVDPGGVSLAQVARARGGFGYLFRRDLTQPGDFADGPALISLDGNSTKFLRPQRSGQDQNAADDIATPDGQPLAISIYTGRLLTGRAAHTPARAVPGQVVRFSASAACCALPGEQLKYTWSLDNNTAPVTGEAITHRFARAGRYRASVAVTGSQGSVALPVETVVIVGAPRRSKGLGSGGNGGPGAPKSGPSTGSPHRVGGGQQGSGQGAGATTPAARTGPTPTDTTPAARTGPTPTDTTTPTTAAPAAAAPVRPVPAPAARRPFNAEQPLAGAGLQAVNGLLVAGPGTLLASNAALPSAPTGAQPGARTGDPTRGGVELPGGAILAVGIFAVGALYERRGPRARMP